MINELIKLANSLDQKGYTSESNYLDAVIKKFAVDVPPQEGGQPPAPPQVEYEAPEASSRGEYYKAHSTRGQKDASVEGSIAALQTLLKAQAQDITVDGYFGPKSIAAWGSYRPSNPQYRGQLPRIPNTVEGAIKAINDANAEPVAAPRADATGQVAHGQRERVDARNQRGVTPTGEARISESDSGSRTGFRQTRAISEDLFNEAKERRQQVVGAAKDRLDQARRARTSQGRWATRPGTLSTEERQQEADVKAAKEYLARVKREQNALVAAAKGRRNAARQNGAIDGKTARLSPDRMRRVNARLNREARRGQQK